VLPAHEAESEGPRPSSALASALRDHLAVGSVQLSAEQAEIKELNHQLSRQVRRNFREHAANREFEHKLKHNVEALQATIESREQQLDRWEQWNQERLAAQERQNAQQRQNANRGGWNGGRGGTRPIRRDQAELLLNSLTNRPQRSHGAAQREQRYEQWAQQEAPQEQVNFDHTPRSPPNNGAGRF
jgi:hypothetical protein